MIERKMRAKRNDKDRSDREKNESEKEMIER